MKTITLTEQIDLGLIKIMALGNLINRKTKMCVFIDDSGHVSEMRVRVLKSKEKYNDKPVIIEIDYSNENSTYVKSGDSDYRLNNINDCISFLEKTLLENNINYHELIPNYENIVSSYFIS